MSRLINTIFLLTVLINGNLGNTSAGTHNLELAEKLITSCPFNNNTPNITDNTSTGIIETNVSENNFGKYFKDIDDIKENNNIACNNFKLKDILNSEKNLKDNKNILIDNLGNNRTIKILSFDGGGTRGYMQSKFLDLFCKDANINDMSDYFDLIAGTSVGGLNAIACANGSTPNFMCNFFREKAPWIFTIRSTKDWLFRSNNASYPSNRPNKTQMFFMGLWSNQFYKATSQTSNYGEVKLRSELNNIFGNKLLTSLKKPVLLTAYNYSEYAPVIFTNAQINDIPDTYRNVKIVDALMATTSCPIYFPSTKLKLSPDPKEPYYNVIDGGLFQNNPSSLAFAAAKLIYPLAKEYCILSLGTGIGNIGLHISSKVKEPSNVALLQYTNFLDIVMNTSQIDNDILFKALSRNKYSNIYYYRFNIQLDNNRDCSFDNSTKEFFDYLDTKVIQKYKEDKSKIKAFIENTKE